MEIDDSDTLMNQAEQGCDYFTMHRRVRVAVDSFTVVF